MEIKTVYVAFGGDPSNDKECYKRYTSTEPFSPGDLNEEVIQFVNRKLYDKAIAVLKFYGSDQLGTYNMPNDDGMKARMFLKDLGEL